MYVSDLEREVIEHVTRSVRKMICKVSVENGYTFFQNEESIPPTIVAMFAAPFVNKILNDLRNEIYEAEKKRG